MTEMIPQFALAVVVTYYSAVVPQNRSLSGTSNNNEC